MWGDEWAHGWETKNGYTIATNPLNSDWYYAALDCNGRLIASSVIVSDGMAEGVTYANGELIPKHLREEIRACDASPKPIPALSDLGLVLLSIMVFVAPFGALANRLQTGRG
jgi:hypothetical protein